MKHIEKNFKKIMGNKIPQDELKILNQLLLELENYPAVDCIYLVPTYDEIEYGRESFDYFYKRLYVIVNKEKLSEEEYKEIQFCINKAYFLLNEMGYYFVNEYELLYIENFDEFYWSSLVSSYIIFDRNEIYGKLQDELKTKVEPFKSNSQYYDIGSLAEIENIDELQNESIKIKELNKKF